MLVPGFEIVGDQQEFVEGEKARAISRASSWLHRARFRNYPGLHAEGVVDPDGYRRSAITFSGGTGQQVGLGKGEDQERNGCRRKPG